MTLSLCMFYLPGTLSAKCSVFICSLQIWRVGPGVITLVIPGMWSPQPGKRRNWYGWTPALQPRRYTSLHQDLYSWVVSVDFTDSLQDLWSFLHCSAFSTHPPFDFWELNQGHCLLGSLSGQPSFPEYTPSITNFWVGWLLRPSHLSLPSHVSCMADLWVLCTPCQTVRVSVDVPSVTDREEWIHPCLRAYVLYSEVVCICCWC